jgi:hypothetical protein
VTNPYTDPGPAGRPGASGEPRAPDPAEAAATPQEASVTSADDDAPLFPTMPNMPDLRRDAIEEAAETSAEARARVAQMNTEEATIDPTLNRPNPGMT